MALRLTLKPSERVFIGGAVIRNGDQRSTLFIENEIPILRETDILKLDQVQGVASQIYLMIQAIYMDPDRKEDYRSHLLELGALMRTIVPQFSGELQQIEAQIADGKLYQALKTCRRLVEHEQEMEAGADPEPGTAPATEPRKSGT